MGKLVLVGLILESEFDRDRLVGYLNESLNDNSYFLNSLYHENLYDYFLVKRALVFDLSTFEFDELDIKNCYSVYGLQLCDSDLDSDGCMPINLQGHSKSVIQEDVHEFGIVPFFYNKKAVKCDDKYNKKHGFDFSHFKYHIIKIDIHFELDLDLDSLEFSLNSGDINIVNSAEFIVKTKYEFVYFINIELGQRDCLCGVEEYCDNILLAYDCAIVSKADSDLILPNNIKTARIVNYSKKKEFNIVFPPSLERLRLYFETFGILKDGMSIPNITLVFSSSVSNNTLEELARNALKCRTTLKVLEGSIFDSREIVIKFLDEMVCKVKFY
jgi:hypothetical protein